MKVFRCQQKLPRSRRSVVHKKIKLSCSICCILEMFDSFIDVTTPIVCTSKRTGFHTSRIFKHIHFIIRSIMKNIILITQKRILSSRSVFRYQTQTQAGPPCLISLGKTQWYSDTGQDMLPGDERELLLSPGLTCPDIFLLWPDSIVIILTLFPTPAGSPASSLGQS